MSRLSTLEDDSGLKLSVRWQCVSSEGSRNARKYWHIQVKCTELEECACPTGLGIEKLHDICEIGHELRHIDRFKRGC